MLKEQNESVCEIRRKRKKCAGGEMLQFPISEGTMKENTKALVTQKENQRSSHFKLEDNLHQKESVTTDRGESYKSHWISVRRNLERHIRVQMEGGAGRGEGKISSSGSRCMDHKPLDLGK